MLFTRKLSPASTISLCRALRHSLGAGINLVQVFRQQAERGTPGVRPLAGRVLAVLEKGHSLSDALDEEKAVVPPLLLSLTKVGEETGHLAEMFGEMEKYFLLQDKLRKQFRSQAMLPMIQLSLAFLILAGLIFVLGLIASARPGAAGAFKGLFGLSGASGAIAFLFMTFGTVALLWILPKFIGRFLRQNPATDALLLHLPIIGSCLEALTMGRFCMALHLTLESGMPIARALQLSLKATGSAAFEHKTDVVLQTVKNGDSLLEALTNSHLFTLDFLSMIAVGEEGGRVPEILRHQADYWNEETALRLKTAMRVASFLIWLFYAIFMVWAISNVAAVYFRGLGI